MGNDGKTGTPLETRLGSDGKIETNIWETLIGTFIQDRDGEIKRSTQE